VFGVEVIVLMDGVGCGCVFVRCCGSVFGGFG